jgi:Kef-type K+ transport system membrane component KefB
MGHLDITQFLALLIIILGSAKIFGALAQRIGQPAVLGELVAGVIVGVSVFGWVDPKQEVIHLLAELGVIILLFAIGLETDLRKLLNVGGASAVVAIVGVVLPFTLGYLACRALGLNNLVALFAGASLTATSVGITARVLSDFGRLQEPESQIVLGAAVIDDIIGLIILTVVTGMASGDEVTFSGIAWTTAVAFGFLLLTLVIGNFAVPLLFRLIGEIDLPGTVTMIALIVALSLAWLAQAVGSALIIGAFAAGVLLARTPRAHEIERGVASLGHFFVPIFFVSVGAAVDLRLLNPLDKANHRTLLIGSVLILVAILTKFAAGYAPFWFRGRKSVIGVGMIPRGEVGLIFATLGLTAGVFDGGLFGAVTLMVMATTFVAPPLLKILLPPLTPIGTRPEPEGIEDLTTEA